jgi:hypothetical protein
MRTLGPVADADGLGLNGHACWLYDDDAELRRVAAQYLADGVTLGQRLLYVGGGEVEKLRADLALLGGADRLEASGRLQVASLEAIYDIDAIADIQERLATYAAATEGAVADGFTGLRVLAEVTALAANPAGWDAHAAWEWVADGYMAREPMSALCCYDRRVLPEEIARMLACVHPAGNADDPYVPFRLFGRADGFVLEGEVDCFSAGLLRRALAAAPEGVELDLAGVRFMDHHAVTALSEASVRVRSTPPLVQRICGILGVSL